MSVREDDRQRNCPSRGLGVAAAAMGVGVGAALYYFFNKRQEAPDASGSTSNWINEEPQALQESFQEDSIIRITDTSTNDDDMDNIGSDNESSESEQESSKSDQESSILDMSDSSQSDINYSDTSESDLNRNSSVENIFDELNTSDISGDSYVTISEHSTSDTSIHDTSHSLNTSLITSQDYEGTYSPSESRTPDMLRSTRLIRLLFPPILNTETPKRNAEIQALAKLREQQFREREWRVEECSICFESMQRNQEVMSLPCSHRFHQPCILPWLQERQTCPNCRKQA